MRNIINRALFATATTGLLLAGVGPLGNISLSTSAFAAENHGGHEKGDKGSKDSGKHDKASTNSKNSPSPDKGSSEANDHGSADSSGDR